MLRHFFILFVLCVPVSMAAKCNSAPSILSISPGTGSTAGGTAFRIAGNGFCPGVSVTFGGVAAKISTVNLSMIAGTTPLRSAGAVTINVTNPNRKSATLANGYTYVAPVIPPTSYSLDDSALAPAGLAALCQLDMTLPIFNVMNYGALGNGTHDDTPAIRSALSAAENAGGGIIYLPTGTYAVARQTGDPRSFPNNVNAGAVFTITKGKIVFIGDGPEKTHIVGHMPGLASPINNYFVTGDSYFILGRFNMFTIDSTNGPIASVQFRSLDVNGSAGYTGNFSVGGIASTGDGWDMTHKGLLISPHSGNAIDNTLVFNSTFQNWRGEELFSGQGNLPGKLNVISSKIYGSNADAISANDVFMANTTLGGSSAGMDVYNGLENFATSSSQATVIQNSTVQCSSSASNPHGNGIVFLGVPGSMLKVTGSTISQNRHAVLFSEQAWNVDMENNLLTNNIQGIITSILGMYSNQPSPISDTGFGNFYIANNTFNNTGAAFVSQNGAFGLHLVNNTVINSYLLSGNFSSATPIPGFIVDGTVFGTNGFDVDYGYTGNQFALWVNSQRAGAVNDGCGTVVNDFSSSNTTLVTPQTDEVRLNAAPYSIQYVVLDKTVLSGYPLGFKTVFKNITGGTTWILKADPAWNEFTNDVVLSPGAAVSITIKASGLFGL